MRKITVFLVLVVVGLAVAVPALAEGPDGQALYDKKCAMCHGKDGMAKTMAKGSANFNDAAFQLSAADIVKVATEGKGKMPAYKDKLSAEEIQAIADYVKTLAPKE